MDAALQSLGGSASARVGKSEVWVRVCPTDGDGNAIDPSADSVVGVDGVHVVVRDPREPAEAPTSQSFRRFKVSGSLGNGAEQEDVYARVGPASLQWLADGFNTSFLSFGQVGTGKSYTMFGGAAGSRARYVTPPAHPPLPAPTVAVRISQRAESLNRVPSRTKGCAAASFRSCSAGSTAARTWSGCPAGRSSTTTASTCCLTQ